MVILNYVEVNFYRHCNVFVKSTWTYFESSSFIANCEISFLINIEAFDRLKVVSEIIDTIGYKSQGVNLLTVFKL